MGREEFAPPGTGGNELARWGWLLIGGGGGGGMNPGVATGAGTPLLTG